MLSSIMTLIFIIIFSGIPPSNAKIFSTLSSRMLLMVKPQETSQKLDLDANLGCDVENAVE